LFVWLVPAICAALVTQLLRTVLHLS
jgi:hypothetical protein